MRLAFFGDIVGKSGRIALTEYLKENKKKYKFDVVIANGENSAHGFGINQSISDGLFEAGVDIITLGNHTFDQKNDLALFDREKRLIRPLNYPNGTPGRGSIVYEIPFLSKKILVINLMGRLFMEANDDPFSKIDEHLNKYKLGVSVDAIFVDFHAEASAEKTAMARFLDGRITALVGTHTHVPTADAQIFAGGTGFLSDSGMCGDYDSVIGMELPAPIKRFTEKVNSFIKMSPASKIATVCGVVFDIDDTGKCFDIQSIRYGGFLKEQKDCER